MPHSYLIDGYNLIHALGLIQKQMAPGGLEGSRRNLLDYLLPYFGADAPFVTIVFDAKHAPRGGRRDQEYHGLSIRFAPKEQSADDLIEAMIETHGEPKNLVVISNDMRLKNAAKKRGAQAWSHEDLLDYFEARKQSSTETPALPDSKIDPVSPEDAQRWLKEFEDVENDPSLKEFFEHDRFDGP